MPAIDQRAGRFCGVVNQCLGPVRARIVQVQRPPRCAQRGQPHYIADRVEQFQVQHRAPASLGIAPDQPLAMTLAHGPRLDPAARIADRAHHGWVQRVERRDARLAR